jgi:hypothetical protein
MLFGDENRYLNANFCFLQKCYLCFIRSNFNKESSPYMEWWCIFQCVGEECMTPICSKQAHIRTKRQTRTCKAAGVWSGRPEMDNWCTTNCLSQRPYCPASHCKCESGEIFMSDIPICFTI